VRPSTVTFKNPPREDSPANDGNRYGELIAAVKFAVEGRKREVPGFIATGLDPFRDAAVALLEMRRGPAKTSARDGFDLAVGSFLAAPSRVQAVKSLEHIPDRPNPDCWPFEAAALLLTRAALDFAAGEPTSAWNAAHLAENNAGSWLERFGDHKIDGRQFIREAWERTEVTGVTSAQNWKDKQARRFGTMVGAGLCVAVQNYAVAPIWESGQKRYVPSALLLEACCREVAGLLRPKASFDLT
jgi:hypothetical protein